MSKPKNNPERIPEREPESLWVEVLDLADKYLWDEIEDPKDRLKQIGIELGGGINEIEDIRGLFRIVRRAKGEI